MMSRFSVYSSCVLHCVLCCVLFAPPTRAQSVNGRIEGTVTDAVGSLVAGANITGRSRQTGLERQVVSNAEGLFVIAELPPDDYDLRIEAPNFKTTAVNQVSVQVGTPTSVTVELIAGSVDETVEVSASTAQEIVNTTNAEIGDVVNRRRILDLPLDGRNPLELIALQAGASETGRVNGVRARGINITINGLNASDNFNKSEDNITSNPTIPVSVESVREFRVTTGLATAEFGRGSAQVNVVSQSGTNRFSGSLFEFHRNTALNANNFFNNRQGLPRENLIRNQFGGRIGGPVLIPKLYNGRNRTFFFFAYEGTRLAASETVNRLVYTADARAGDFRYLQGLPVTPTAVAANPNLIRRVNVLSLSRRTVDPTLAAFLARTPLPNNFDVGDGLNTGGFRFNARRSAPKDIYSFRGDHRFNANHTLELNLSYGNDFQIGDVVNNRLQRFPDEFGTNRLTRGRSISTALQSTLTARTVNEFRLGYVNPTTDFNNPSFQSPFLLTLNTVDDPARLNAPNGRQIPVLQFIDNLTHVRGAHIIKAGFDIRRIRGRVFSFEDTLPILDFNNADNDPGLTTAQFAGISTASANLATVAVAERLLNNLTGAIGSITQNFNAVTRDGSYVAGSPLRRDYGTRELDFYVQDTWKVRPNLTLNLGLRYEYSTVPSEADNLIALPVGGLQGVYGPTAINNLFVPGNLSNPRTTTDLVPDDFQFFNPDRNNFAPVISFAYSPGGDARTSLRAGYRVSYIRENFNLFENIVRSNPGLTLTTETVANRFLRDGVPPITPPALNFPLALPQLFQATNGNVDVYGFDENLRTPYVQEWTGSIEREIFKDTVVEARYVGNRGIKLIRVYDVNEVNVLAFDAQSNQTFLDAFRVAQSNLEVLRNARAAGAIAANTPDSFAFNPAIAGSRQNALFTRFFGAATNANYRSSTFITPLQNGEAGELADIVSRRSVGGVNGGLLFNSGLPLNFLRPNPDADSAQIVANTSRSSFHALQLEIRRRFRDGLSFQANYQFGKELSDFTGSTTNNRSFVTLRDVRYEYQSQTPYHQFKANALYDLPFGRGRKFLNQGGLVNLLLGGFQVGGIVRAESGLPITITSGRGTLNRASRSAINTVDVVSNQSLEALRDQLGVRTVGGQVFYFDPTFRNNFRDPQPGTLGSLPRTSFVGPRFFRTDFSIIKRARFTESQNIEFRTEMFNVFNTVNFDTPNTNFNSANFGVISGVRGNPRIIQLALRYNF